MSARMFDKRIGIYEVSDTPDGYGGNTVIGTFIMNVWAKVTTAKSISLEDRDWETSLRSYIKPPI